MEARRFHVGVVIPTVDGREHWLGRCRASYERTLAEYEAEILVIPNQPTCGDAWNIGVLALLMGQCDVIHLTADDIEAHDGWLEAGFARLNRNELPAARILNGDGSLQSCGDQFDRPEGFVTEIARIPLLTPPVAAAIFPIPDGMHYYTDNVVSDRARAVGWPTVVTRDYLFTHHLAGEGRLDRLDTDHDLWLQSRS